MQEKNNKVIDKENNDKKPFVLSDKWKAVILAFVLVAFFVIVIFSPAFSVKEINIQDSEYYTEEELLESFSQFKGKNGNILLINNTKFSQASGIFNRHLTVVEEQMLFDYPLRGAYLPRPGGGRGSRRHYEKKHTLVDQR